VYNEMARRESGTERKREREKKNSVFGRVRFVNRAIRRERDCYVQHGVESVEGACVR
jgi:hypothetical protein